MTELRRFAKIETHENVTIQYETAGIGSRLISYIVDTAIMIAVFVAFTALMIGMELNIPFLDGTMDYLLSIEIVAWFIARYFYYIIFERIMKGSTPGKKIMHLRVIAATGEAETFLMSVVRNFFRIADILPAGYLVGAIFSFFDERNRRLGDRVANTIVVRVSEGRKLRKFTKKIDELAKAAEDELKANESANAEISTAEPAEVPPFEADIAFLKEYFAKKKAYYSNDIENAEFALLKSIIKKYSMMSSDAKFKIKRENILPALKDIAQTDGSQDAVESILQKYEFIALEETPAETILKDETPAESISQEEESGS